MSLLFQPLKLRNVTFRNRLVISPMCQYSATNGYANDWHLVHLGSRAVGGAGLILQEATAVAPEGRISPGDLGLWEDGQVDFLRRINSFLKSQGAVPGIQLAHAGRKASHSSPWEGGRQIPIAEGGWTAFGPGNDPFRPGTEPPAGLDEAGINKVKADFVKAARRALDAGFEVIEIHAAHGYLLHEFYSPLCNARTDEYGGSFENRVRLLSEITKEVRSEIGEGTPLLVRISATDWVDGGWDIEDSIALARILQSLGVDLVDCSTGGNTPGAQIPVGPMYQVPFASAIREAAQIPTGAVGMITTAEEAESILEDGHADLVFIARQSLRDPYFPLHAAKADAASTLWPHQYERAR